MRILVTGSTGVIGGQVISHLNALGGKDLDIRALTRDPAKASAAGTFPATVTPVAGDLTQIDAMRAAVRDIDALFLLAPNAADELTQAMQAMNIAREVGVKGIVYLSVFGAAAYSNVPHFIGKRAVEWMIEDGALPVTILRPTYFIQNDLRQQMPLMMNGVYAQPIGGKGLSMVDIRDIGEVAARELLRRAANPTPQPSIAYTLAGPDPITADAAVAIWAEVLSRPIRHAGNDLDSLEATLKSMMPHWYAYDLRLMMQRYQQQGAIATPDEIAALTAILGRPPRSYRAFAEDAAKQWLSA
ncbi:NmrA family NAD(P)-binding protein [Robbsia sp. KACC 23696]|uniref:SDR family oxidoreductase n=1 Tax=Robbsia sp. KACC 23696 TaxID=3149231 RepID=UPI00325A570F